MPCAPVRRQGLCVPDRGPTSLVQNPVLERNPTAVAHGLGAESVALVLGVMVARRLIVVGARRLVQMLVVEPVG